jgi:hypothetical protein
MRIVERSRIRRASRRLKKAGVESLQLRRTLWISVPRASSPRPSNITELERLGDRIAELSAHLDAATASLLDLIREFDQRGGWGNGFRSCAEWLSWRVGLDLGAARERVRVALALETLPRLAQALAHGELSYAKVRALTRVATPETEERLPSWGGPARRRTWSGSYAAGAPWTGGRSYWRRRSGTRPGPCTCIKTKTAW